MISNVAIVGGGISGTLTVLQCIKQCRKPLSIIWFDAHHKFGKGFAYSTSNEAYLLNVRANNMSVFPDEPNHFTDWLNQYYPIYHSKSFVPRKIYGEYVHSVFDALKNSNSFVSVVQVAEEVIAIDKTNGLFTLTAEKTYQAEKLVLAFGNFLPAHPRSVSREFIDSDAYFQNAFDGTLMTKVLTHQHLTIIGSGLTMIDLIVSLYNNSYQGHIHIISPHAYIPQEHQENSLSAISPFIDANKTYTLSDIVSLVNQQFKKAQKEQLNPHSIIDAMRPYLQTIWLNFSLKEKQQFLRHLRHKWGVARHRSPHESMSVFNEWMSLGRITLTKGRIYDIKTIKPGFEISYSDAKKEQQNLKTELIVNCTGPESDYSQLKSTLVKYLVKSGFIAPDPLNYGLNASKNGQLSENVYTLGPPLKGILWESVAVPEIRVQAKELASKIICD